MNEYWKIVEPTLGQVVRDKIENVVSGGRLYANLEELLVSELNFRQLGKEEFTPSDVDSKIDHAKLAKHCM